MANHKERQYSKMIWGKYKGWFIKDIPTDYLKWAVMNMTDQAMATFLAEELAFRIPQLNKKIKA